MNEILPVGWKLRTLKDIAEITGGGTPNRSTAKYFGGDIPWVTPSDLPPIGEVTELGEVKNTLTEEGLRSSSARLLPVGTVLYSSRASIGKIAVTNRQCATNQGFANFTVKPDKADAWFLAYYLCLATSKILQLAGETTYKEVRRGKLKEFPISLPPLNEQRRIVGRIKECLSRVDEIRRLREETWQEVIALQAASLNEIEKGLSCPMVKVGDIIEDSQNGRSIRSDEINYNGHVLTLSAVRTLELDVEQRKPVQLTDSIAEKYGLKTNDVFISRANTIELVGLASILTNAAPERTIYPDLMIKLTPVLAKIRPKYMALALRFPSVRRQIQHRAKGSSQSMVKISGASLREVSIPLPNLDEQETIIAKADEARNATALLKAEIDQKEGSLVFAVKCPKILWS